MSKIQRYFVNDRGLLKAYRWGEFVLFKDYLAEVEQLHEAYRALLIHHAQCAAHDIGGVPCGECETLEGAVGITEARDLRASIDNMRKTEKP